MLLSIFWPSREQKRREVKRTRNGGNDDSQAPGVELTIPAEKGYYHLAINGTASAMPTFLDFQLRG